MRVSESSSAGFQYSDFFMPDAYASAKSEPPLSAATPMESCVIGCNDVGNLQITHSHDR